MNKTLTHVLLIENNPADILRLREALEQDILAAFEVTAADRLESGIELLRDNDFDVILLNLGLPDSQGLDTFIKLHREFPETSTIILSEFMDEELALQAIQFGAQDYLVKRPEAWETAARTIRYAVERQRSQLALHESESRFRTLFEHSPVAYQSLDANGNYVDFNTQLCELLGYEPHELLGKSFGELWSPEMRSTFPRKFDRFKREGKMEADLQIVKKDGTAFEILMQGKIQYDRNGQASRAHCILHDITSRKIAEQALRESQERFSAVFRSNPLGISITELADGTIIDANESFLNMFGYTRAEILRHTTLELKMWQASEDRQRNIKKLRRHGEVTNTELKFRRKSGETINALASYRLIELNGRQYVLNMLNDITDRKQIEQALNDNEKRFQALLENGLDNISLLSAEGVLVWESPATIRMLDYDPNEFVGRNIFELLHPEDRERILHQFAELVHKPGSRQRDTFRLRHSDGSWRWVEAIVTNLLDQPSVNAMVVNYRDITEQKELERALQKSELLFLQIFQFSPIPLAIEDSNGTIITSNESYLQLTGYRADEVIGNTMSGLRLYPDHAQLPLTPRPSPQPGTVDGTEFKLHTKSGEIRNVLDWNGPIQLGGNEKINLRAIVDITGRKQAEEKLRESEARFASIFHANPIRVCITSFEDGRFLDVNETFLKSGGYTREEVIGQTSLELHDWVDPQERIRLRSLLEAQGRIQNFEAQLRQKSGDIINVLLSAELIELFGQRCILSVGFDITERKQTEEQQREREKWYRTLFENSPIAIWEEDFSEVKKYLGTLKQQGLTDFKAYFESQPDERSKCSLLIKVLNVNNTAVQMYRAESKAQLIENTNQAVSRGEMEHNYQDFIAIAEGQTSNSWEGADETLTGESLEIKLSWSVIPGYEDDYSKVIVTTIDITERKRAEEALRESEQRYRTLIDQTPAVVYIDDSSTNPGRTQFVSPYIQTMLGFTPAEWIQGGEELWKTQLHPDDRDRVLDEYKRSIQSDEPLELEYRVCAKDERVVWVRDQATTLRDGAGNPNAVHGVMYDITERKQTESERQALMDVMRGAISTRDLLAYLNLVHHSIASVIRAENFFVILHNKESGRFEEIYSVDQYDAPQPPSQLEKSISAYVFRSGKPLLLKQALFEELVERGEVELIGKNSSSWLGVPLITSRETTGVMVVQDYENADRYLESDKDFLVSIAGQVALIIERMQAEAELASLNRQLELILNSAGEGVYGVNTDGNLTFINPAAAEMLGWEVAELIGRHGHSIFHHTYPDGRPYPDDECPIYMAFRDGITRSVDADVFWRKDGTSFPVEYTSTPVHEGAKIIGTVVVVKDITERKLADEKLRESEERFSSAFQYAPIGIALVALDGHWLKINRALCELTGYAEPELLQRTFQDITHPDDLETDLNYVNRMLTGEIQSYQMEKRYIHKNGKIVWVMLSVSLVFSKDNLPLYFISQIQDVTQRKQIEVEISHQLSELEALYENGLAISRMLEPKQIAHRIVQVLDQKLAWHHAAVRILHPESGRLELLALSQPGLNDTQIKEQIERLNQFILNPEYGLSGWVIKLRTAVRIGNLKENPNYVETYPGIQSGLYVPIRSGEEIIGSIAVESEQENAFTERDERLLITLANQAAISFVNARLYLRLQYELSERHRTEDKIRKLNAELEQRVQERTLEIETTHQRLELATASSGIGVWELKSGRDTFYWDERMYGIYGTTPERLNPTSANWLELVHPEDRQAEAEKRAWAIGHAGSYQSEYRVIRTDGSVRHINSHAVVLFDEKRNFKGMIGVNMDITTLKQAEATLRMANNELERALSMKDEFLANMSHELRTPLNAILGLSESLDEQIVGPLNEKQQKYIQTISESGRHLLSLINDILDLAKIEAGQITLDISKMDVHVVCQSSLRMIKELAQKKNQQAELNIDPKIDLIWADERRLKQMLVNLLSNAVKFTPAGGKIGLEVRVDESNNQVEISVWDTGIGIKDADLRRLFQPFVQLNAGLARESGGTGLGLALVAQMARLHGGSVAATSQPGAGSRFMIVLPWEPALATDTMSRLKRTGTFRPVKVDDENSRRTILLVEDTEEVTMMIRDYLESAAYQVVVATNGQDGIVQAKRYHPDLILMDVQMPGMDGLEATQKLRSESDFQQTPIIALTALAMPSDRERCLAAGMNEYMSKPVKLKALLQVIQSLLSKV